MENKVGQGWTNSPPYLIAVVAAQYPRYGVEAVVVKGGIGVRLRGLSGNSSGIVVICVCHYRSPHDYPGCVFDFVS